MISYEELAQRLASDLPYLRFNDFINLRSAAGYVQWPLGADSARDLAAAIVEVAQAFLSADTAGIECNARNYDTWEPLDLASLRDLRRSADSHRR